MIAARLEALWSAIPYPAIVVGPDDSILMANPAAESFAGVSLRQVNAEAGLSPAALHTAFLPPLQ